MDLLCLKVDHPNMVLELDPVPQPGVTGDASSLLEQFFCIVVFTCTHLTCNIKVCVVVVQFRENDIFFKVASH